MYRSLQEKFMFKKAPLTHNEIFGVYNFLMTSNKEHIGLLANDIVEMNPLSKAILTGVANDYFDFELPMNGLTLDWPVDLVEDEDDHLNGSNLAKLNLFN